MVNIFTMRWSNDFIRHLPFNETWHIVPHTICSLNIPNNSLYNASYYMCRKISYFTLPIGSHLTLRKWRRRPHFPIKLAAVASFSYKIGGGGLIFGFSYEVDGSGKDLATLLAAVLTWSGYWNR